MKRKVARIWWAEYRDQDGEWCLADGYPPRRMKYLATEDVRFLRNGASPCIYRVAEYRRVEKEEKP